MIRVDHPPYGKGSRTGNWLWFWDWHNKLSSRIVLRTPAQNDSVSRSTSPFHPFTNRATHALHIRYTERSSLWRFVCRQWWVNIIHKTDYTDVKSWEFGVKKQGTVKKWEDKRDHFSLYTLLKYDPFTVDLPWIFWNYSSFLLELIFEHNKLKNNLQSSYDSLIFYLIDF